MKTISKHNLYASHTFTWRIKKQRTISVNFGNSAQDYQVLGILMNSNMTQICQNNQQRAQHITESAASS